MRPAVIMPVYNEEETLAGVVDAVRERFGGLVIVVDDGSTDGTGGILRGRTDVDVVRHGRNLGYGRSLEDGFRVAEASGADVVITMDCDGQHEPRHIPEFLAALAEGSHDIISGSRYLPQSGRADAPPPQRREVNARVAAEVNRVTGWGITDAFCGFKAYRLKPLLALRLHEPGYGMPMELWAKAYADGLRVVESPVERIYFDHDRSFGEDLDDPERRYAYYMRVWCDALAEAGILCEHTGGDRGSGGEGR